MPCSSASGPKPNDVITVATVATASSWSWVSRSELRSAVQASTGITRKSRLGKSCGTKTTTVTASSVSHCTTRSAGAATGAWSSVRTRNGSSTSADDMWPAMVPSAVSSGRLSVSSHAATPSDAPATRPPAVTASTNRLRSTSSISVAGWRPRPGEDRTDDHAPRR